ncbi:MAG TPA: archease [Candidatus Omnitrophota bacterium]|nr:archease [Candidatus Omnitrophota bacterium]HPS19385.1 archease [Candidatus Omnitrophota bacterium]
MNRNIKRYEQIPHTADIAARIYGKTIEELFVNAAFAMFDIISGGDQMPGSKKIIVQKESENIENLLVGWLNELLYVSYEKRSLLCDFKIILLNEKKIEAEVYLTDPADSTVKKEIKAATYYDVKIVKDNGRFIVDVVFDV